MNPARLKTLAACLLACQLFLLPAPRPACAGPPESPAVFLSRMLAVELQIKAVREREEEKARQVESLRAKILTAQNELQSRRQQLAAAQKAFLRQLSFFYRLGPASLLGVLLGAESFGDFVNRSFFVGALLARQVRLVESIRQHAASIAERLGELEKLESDLAGELEAQRLLLARLERLRNDKALLEEQLRSLPPPLARELLETSRRWAGLLFGLQGTMARLGELPAGTLTADRFSLTASGMVVEISESTLNRLLDLARDGALEAVSVRLSPGGATVEGRLAGGGEPFYLEGELGFDRREGVVYLSPRAIGLQGQALEGELLDFLAASRFLAWRVGDFAPLEVASVTATQGRLAITLAGRSFPF